MVVSSYEFECLAYNAGAFSIFYLLIPKLLQQKIIIPPVVFHLDEELQEDLFFQKSLHVQAGFHAQLFDRHAIFTNQNGFLGVTFYKDSRRNPGYRFTAHRLVFFKLLDDHLGSIGNFLVVQRHDFFPNDFRDKKALRAVGQLVFGVIFGTFGEIFF